MFLSSGGGRLSAIPDFTLSEGEDLLVLHSKKPLTHCQALAMAHLHFDPLAGQPFLSAYRPMLASNLSWPDKGLSSYFCQYLENHSKESNRNPEELPPDM